MAVAVLDGNHHVGEGKDLIVLVEKEDRNVGKVKQKDGNRDAFGIIGHKIQLMKPEVMHVDPIPRQKRVCDSKEERGRGRERRVTNQRYKSSASR